MNIPQARQFHFDAKRLTQDLRHRTLIQKALSGYYKKRDEQKFKYEDWQSARMAAAAAKYEAINHLDSYLTEFADKISARGTKVFWAANGAEASDYIISIAQKIMSDGLLNPKQ